MNTDDKEPLVLIAAKVPPDMALAIKAYARGQGKSFSQVLRDLITAKLQEFEL